MAYYLPRAALTADDNSAARSFAHAPYMQETLMRLRSVRKLSFLSVMDIHTYKRDAKQD